MGNIHFEQGAWSAAIKQYRQALDNVPANAKEIRYKILRNIGHAFVRMGQYSEALRTYDEARGGAAAKGAARPRGAADAADPPPFPQP